MGAKTLLTLILSHNRLITLDADVFHGLINLDILNIEANQLTVLSNGIFRNLNKLRYLSCGYNQLVTLPLNAFLGLEECNLHSPRCQQFDVFERQSFCSYETNCLLSELKKISLYN